MTSDKLIPVDELLKVLKHRVKGNEDSLIVLSTNNTLSLLEDFVQSLPTVDAVPVVHGHWIPIPKYENKRCSVCRSVFSDFTLGYYCPYCGAKMDGDIDVT